MRGIYYYQITCLFWLPTVYLALCQLLKIKAQSQNSLFFRPYHVECGHWTWVLKESARRKLHSTQKQPQARVLKRWPDICSAILPTKLMCLLMADTTPPELKHPDLEPTCCIVKTLEIMCTTHPWVVYPWFCECHSVREKPVSGVVYSTLYKGSLCFQHLP